jgi:hypothetical protein
MEATSATHQTLRDPLPLVGSDIPFKVWQDRAQDDTEGCFETISNDTLVGLRDDVTDIVGIESHAGHADRAEQTQQERCLNADGFLALRNEFIRRDHTDQLNRSIFKARADRD